MKKVEDYTMKMFFIELTQLLENKFLMQVQLKKLIFLNN